MISMPANDLQNAYSARLSANFAVGLQTFKKVDNLNHPQ
jgi:hypothetical protein